MIFKKAYTSLTEYKIIQVFEEGNTREVSEQQIEYTTWISEGNTPEIISGDRFITIVDNQPVLNPDKDSIILSEAKSARKLQANINKQKAQENSFTYSGIKLNLAEKTINRSTMLSIAYKDSPTAEIGFKDIDGIFHIITGVAACSIVVEVNTKLQMLYSKEKTIFESIDACFSVQEVNSVDITF